MASIVRCVRTAAFAGARTSTTALSSSTTSSGLAVTRSRYPAARLPHQNFPRSFSSTPTSLLRKYTKDHEWIDLKGDSNVAVIGISEYAAEQLGDVVYVELPEEGTSVKAGDPMGAVESVKSAADINAPVTCTIKDVNLVLEEKPSTINKTPEDDSVGGGWIAKVVLEEDATAELEKLMSADEYKAWVATEEH